jgi:hypothetical protein
LKPSLFFFRKKPCPLSPQGYFERFLLESFQRKPTFVDEFMFVLAVSRNIFHFLSPGAVGNIFDERTGNSRA